MRHFCGIEQEQNAPDKAKVSLQSIPYDGTSTWGKGADKGYEAFMDALDNMETFDIETGTEVYQHGVYLEKELKVFDSPEDMMAKTYQRSKEIIASGRYPTFFGGEHSISIGVIRAMKEEYTELSVLQIDAHADLRPSYLGTPFNHACALYESSRNCNLIQVGIRSAEKEEMQWAQEGNVFFAHEMHGHSRWMQESIDRLGEQVYITLDLDAFDPSILPGTGTPEPGGIGWYDMIRYLRMVFEQKEVVGFDIVELAPIEGEPSSEFLVAKLYYKMLSYKFLNA